MGHYCPQDYVDDLQELPFHYEFLKKDTQSGTSTKLRTHINSCNLYEGTL